MKSGARTPIGTDIETFSTFDVEPQATARQWRLFMKEVWFRLDIEAARSEAINGRLAKRSMASLDVSFLSADDQKVIRSRESISSDSAECFCLVFVTRGQFTCRQLGRSASVAPGDVYLLNAHEPYEVDLANDPEMLCLTVPADIFRSRVKHVDDYCARDQIADRTLSFALRSLVCGALAKEPIADPIRLQDLCLNMADMMLSPGAEIGGQRFGYSEQNSSFVIAKANHAMRMRFKDVNLSIGKVAQSVGVSTRQLQHAYQKAGTTFVVELTKIRLNAAANALRSNACELSRIGDIAADCGFASQAYFATCFKRFFGHSPRDEPRKYEFAQNSKPNARE